MDPAMAMYHAQLYKNYWEQRTALSLSSPTAAAAAAGISWPYGPPVFTPPGQPGGTSSASSESAAASSAVAAAAAAFPLFPNYWSLFGQQNESGLPPAAPAAIKTEPRSPQYSSALTNKEESNPPTCQPPRPKREPQFESPGTKSSTGSRSRGRTDFSDSASVSPVKRPADDDSVTPFVRRLPCDSSSELARQVTSPSIHQETDDEDTGKNLVIREPAQHKSSARWSPGLGAAPERRATACQTDPELVESDLCRDLLKTELQEDASGSEVVEVPPRVRWNMNKAKSLSRCALGPPLLTRELTRCDVDDTGCQDPSTWPPPLPAAAAGPSSSALLLAPPGPPDIRLPHEWRLVHEPSTGRSYRVPRMMLQPLPPAAAAAMSATCRPASTARSTQTRDPKRVLCDSCLKKCRLRKRTTPAPLPPPVTPAAPLIDLCGSLCLLSKFSESSTSGPSSPVTQAVAELCSSFLTDLTKFEEQRDPAAFEGDVTQQLTAFLERLQSGLEPADNSVANLRLPFDTAQRREVDTSTDSTHFPNLHKLSKRDRNVLEQLTEIGRRLAEVKRASKRAASRAQTAPSSPRNTTGQVGFSPFRSQLHEFAFIAAEQNEESLSPEKPRRGSGAASSTTSSHPQLDTVPESPLFTEPLRIDTSLCAVTERPVLSNSDSTSVATSMGSPGTVASVVAAGVKRRISSDNSAASSKKMRKSTDGSTSSSGGNKKRHKSSVAVLSVEDTAPPDLEKEAPVLEPRPPTPELRGCSLDREDLRDGQRILITVDGNWFAATLHSDSRREGHFSAALDGGRQLSLSSDQLLNSAVVEIQPHSRCHLPLGSRVAAYWSEQLSNLYPGTVADAPPDVQLDDTQIFVAFDDEDERVVEISKVRMLPEDTPVMPADARADIFLSLPRRPRQSQSKPTDKEELPERRKSSSCSSDKPGTRLWQWGDRGTQKGKRTKHKVLLCNKEQLRVGDAAQFLSADGERPYLGRIEAMYEENGDMWVRASWFYQPTEMGTAGKPYLETPAAIFSSSHCDTNEAQTILRRVRVLTCYQEFLKAEQESKPESKERLLFYEAGEFDAVHGTVTPATAESDVSSEMTSSSVVINQ